jgi:Na+-driven multidrug efflux pump
MKDHPEASRNKNGAFSSKLEPRHRDIFSKKSLSDFWNPTFSMVAFQLNTALPFVISAVMIALTGDTFSLAVFGLALTLMSMVYNSILNSLTEIIGVKCAQLFPQKQYERMNAILWKGFICIIVHLVLIYFIIAHMYDILVAINIESSVAYGTTLFFYGSMKFLPFQSVNNALVSYISSQGVTKPLVYINILSIFIVTGFSKYFIFDLNMKEYGYIYSKLIQEVVNLFLYLYVLFAYLDRRSFTFPRLGDFMSENKSFFSVLFKTVMSNYADYVGFEVNTYLVALMHRVSDLALWCTFCNYLYIAYTISSGFSNAFRMLIGHKIGEKKYLRARTLTQHYLIHTAMFSFVVVIIILYFKYELAFALTGDLQLSFRMAKYLSVYCFSIYPAFGFTAMFTIHRLLREDNFLMILSTLIYPTCTIFFSWLLCYPFGLGVDGVVYSFTFFKAAIFWILVINAFYRFDWTKIPEDDLIKETTPESQLLV